MTWAVQAPEESPALSESVRSSIGRHDGRRSSIADDPRVAPRGILFGHPHHQTSDLREHAWTIATRFRMRPFPRDKLPMPTENRVWGDNRGDLAQPPTAQPVPRIANRRRSSSVKRIRPRTCPRRVRFSSISTRLRPATGRECIPPTRLHGLETLGRQMRHYAVASIATLVTPQPVSQSARRCRSSVKVLSDRTGVGSRSGGTATKCSADQLANRC